MILRILDLFLAGVTSIVFLPAFIVVATVVRITMGSPVFFTQERPGLHGKVFTVYKFRTMTVDRGPDGELLPDSARRHSVGSFLRRTSLDELPQLWNVLLGDLSLVGPRPLLIRYLPRYTPEQARRHDVRPGLTGLAQISGRNAISWEDKFRLDVWYVENQSVRLYLVILAKTLVKVLKRDGIYEDEMGTMREFMGSASEETPTAPGKS